MDFLISVFLTCFIKPFKPRKIKTNQIALKEKTKKTKLKNQEKQVTKVL